MRKETILIIDDDQDLAKIVQLSLDREGYQTVIATSGLEGLQEAYRVQPDLVILDIMMPGMDGWEVCHLQSLQAASGHHCLIAFSLQAQLHNLGQILVVIND